MEELDKSMYFNASHPTMEAARILRKNMTKPENILWERLKGNQVCGLRFRRQHPIDFFIADFYCHAAKLVIEVDGEIHGIQNEYDDGRSAEMEKYGIKVIRFKNDYVENNIDKVVKIIESIVINRLKSPPWGI